MSIIDYIQLHDEAISGRWQLDPERSSAGFRVKLFWGLSTVRGRFDKLSGRLDLSADPAIELTIDAASVQTKNARRDRHLRSADFFDAENHPRVRFISDSLDLQGRTLRVRGRLSARGSSIPLELEAQLHEVDDGLEIEATTTAPHRDLGMTFNWLGMIPQRSTVVVRALLVRA